MVQCRVGGALNPDPTLEPCGTAIVADSCELRCVAFRATVQCLAPRFSHHQ